MSYELTALEKFKLLRSTFSNWPQVAPDKLGIGETYKYRTHDGVAVICRSRSSDVNEGAAILSGYEYPAKVFAGIIEGSVVIDAGANIGLFCLQASRVCLSQPVIHAVEPFDANVSILKANLSMNGLGSVRVHRLALSHSEYEGHIRTDLPPDAVTLTEGAGQAIRATRLSTFCDDNKIDQVDLLKMDIEGGEYDVITSDRAFISTRVRRLVLEYHSSNGLAGRQTIVNQLGDSHEVEDIHKRGSEGVLLLTKR